MTTLTARTAVHGPRLDIARFAPRRAWLVQVPPGAQARAGWMDRLAAWAERQPVHHRVGSWERLT